MTLRAVGSHHFCHPDRSEAQRRDLASDVAFAFRLETRNALCRAAKNPYKSHTSCTHLESAKSLIRAHP
jgi:hypothetical protein